jgi:hypothetical protein
VQFNTLPFVYVIAFSASSLLKQIKMAFNSVDVIITSGGVSMGEKVFNCTRFFKIRIYAVMLSNMCDYLEPSKMCVRMNPTANLRCSIIFPEHSGRRI